MKYVILTLFLFTPGCIGCDRGYSEGDRSGVVVKISRKGLLMKSWEGQLNLGGTVQNSEGNAIPSTWEFTVVDPAIVSVVQAAQDSGKRVKCHYTQWLTHPLGMDTDYEVVEVK